MDMASTTTATAMPSRPTAGMGMGMGMGMGGGTGCKISMLFNLYTIDACFLSSQWKITSAGMFAGSCIGVFLLALSLEFLRRSVKEYDRFLVKQHRAKYAGQTAKPSTSDSATSKDGLQAQAPAGAACVRVPPFRPNVWQQGVRALLHLLVFFVAYILMLLAMYYNGYLLICIFLGSFIGAFVFQWETLAGA
ncbi:hypothetical protein UVI_02017940 [Ustilaginoidea virens]|uniref:Copper transport protein n=1 Tax=Ustilaginoidea virens TaxID=1159556 RepID=A0A1B5KS61_USTVR|nr:hypothetical protein UVI_02017940 [Ustilaginoidea virens]